MNKFALDFWRNERTKAQEKFAKAKTPATMKKWNRQLQVCGMMLRDLEKEEKKQ